MTPKLFHVERTDSAGPRGWMDGTRRPRTVALLTLALLPALVAALLLGTAWGRNQRLHRIEAAVVNSDQAVQLNGKSVPMGRQLAAEIVSKPSTNINWTLSDPADAADGLRTGRYAAVVTIPQNFSRAATSVAKASTAQQAVIDVATSPASSVQDAQIARQVADLATQSLNATLTGGYLDNVYIGFNKFGSSMVTMGNGAQQLADGAGKLDDGIGQASNGTAGLARGLAQLDANGGKLTSGATQLSSGAEQLSSGVTQYTAGTSRAVDGIGQLSGGITQLDNGLKQQASGGQFGQLQQLKTGAAQLATGAQGLSSGLGSYQRQLDAWGSGKQAMPTQVGTAFDKNFAAQCTSQVGSSSRQLGQRISQQLTPPVRSQIQQRITEAIDAYQQNAPTPLTPAQTTALTQQLDKALSTQYLTQALSDPTLAKQVSQQVCPQVAASAKPVFAAGFQAGTATASAALDVKDPRSGQSLKSGAAALATGAGRLSSGVATLVDMLPRQVAAQLKQLTSAVDQLAAGAQTLASKSQQLKSGGAQLSSGASQLASGAGQYATGVGQYTAGVGKASDGAQQLATGMTQLDSGAGKLATGLGTFATKVKQGAAQVPSYSAVDREKLSTVVSTPVTGAADGINSPLAQLVGLVLVLVAWLASLLTWLVSRPLPQRLLTSSRPSWQLAAQVMAPGALLAVAQGALLGILGSVALHLGAGRGFGLTAFLVLVALAFTAVNHALAAWLGGIGRTIALLLATVTAAVGTVSAVPGAFSTIHHASPLAPALTGVRAIIARASMGAGPVATLLFLWLLGVAFGLFAVLRRRRLSADGYLRNPAQS